MQEKDMVSDYLSSLNCSLGSYAGYISQTDNLQLRQKLQEIRNSDENRQYTWYQLAKQKGYYQPARPADHQEIQNLYNSLTQG